ncbi:MAG TPA: hypothetical protein VND94_00925 [Terriglobia bacterium]|nr:hypothetical protein [Terriglobia bacterium]
MNQCVLYGLYATDEGLVRYIGQTRKSVHGRYSIHLMEARNKTRKTRLANWIRDVWARGQGVSLRIIDRQATWNESEIAEIARLRDAGQWLVNDKPGGTWANSDPDLVSAKVCVTRPATDQWIKMVVESELAGRSILQPVNR